MSVVVRTVRTGRGLPSGERSHPRCPIHRLQGPGRGELGPRRAAFGPPSASLRGLPGAPFSGPATPEALGSAAAGPVSVALRLVGALPKPRRGGPGDPAVCGTVPRMRLRQATAIWSRRGRWGLGERLAATAKPGRGRRATAGRALGLCRTKPATCPRAPQLTRPAEAGGPGGARRSLEDKAALRFSPHSLPELTWQFSTQARKKGHRKCPAPGPASQGSGTEMFRRGWGREREASRGIRAPYWRVLCNRSCYWLQNTRPCVFLDSFTPIVGQGGSFQSFIHSFTICLLTTYYVPHKHWGMQQ